MSIIFTECELSFSVICNTVIKMNFGQRCFSYFKTFSKKNFIGKCIRVAVPTRIMAYAVTFSFEDENKLDITKNIPDKPIEIPSSDLSHEFFSYSKNLLTSKIPQAIGTFWSLSCHMRTFNTLNCG